MDKGITIFSTLDNVLRVVYETPLDDVKVVMLGQELYKSIGKANTLLSCARYDLNSRLIHIIFLAILLLPIYSNFVFIGPTSNISIELYKKKLYTLKVIES